MLLTFHGALVAQRTFKLKNGKDGHEVSFSTDGEIIHMSSEELLPQEMVLQTRDYVLQLGVRTYEGRTYLFIKTVQGLERKATKS
jgi:hypothetical protein